MFFCPSSGVFHCTHSSGIWHIGLLCVQWKTADDGQRNCPKHAVFYSKNKFEKLVHLVGFIIRIYYDARSPGRHLVLGLSTWRLFNQNVPSPLAKIPLRRCRYNKWPFAYSSCTMSHAGMVWHTTWHTLTLHPSLCCEAVSLGGAAVNDFDFTVTEVCCSVALLGRLCNFTDFVRQS